MKDNVPGKDGHPGKAHWGRGGALSVMRGVDVNEAERREQQRRRDGKPSQCRAGENTAVTATAILNQLESDKSERERTDRKREEARITFLSIACQGTKKEGISLQ